MLIKHEKIYIYPLRSLWIRCEYQPQPPPVNTKYQILWKYLSSIIMKLDVQMRTQ